MTLPNILKAEIAEPAPVRMEDFSGSRNRNQNTQTATDRSLQMIRQSGKMQFSRHPAIRQLQDEGYSGTISRTTSGRSV